MYVCRSIHSHICIFWLWGGLICADFLIFSAAFVIETHRENKITDTHSLNGTSASSKVRINRKVVGKWNNPTAFRSVFTLDMVFTAGFSVQKVSLLLWLLEFLIITFKVFLREIPVSLKAEVDFWAEKPKPFIFLWIQHTLYISFLYYILQLEGRRRH